MSFLLKLSVFYLLILCVTANLDDETKEKSSQSDSRSTDSKLLDLGDSIVGIQDTSFRSTDSIDYDDDELEVILSSLVTSTPKKMPAADCNISASSDIWTRREDISLSSDFDVEFLGEVYATPKPCKSSDYLIGEATPRESKLLGKAMQYSNIKNSLKTNCHCGCQCIKKFTLKEIASMRQRYWTKPRKVRSDYVLQTLQLAKNSKFLQCDNGVQVCKLAFRNIMRINKNTMTSFNKKMQTGATTITGCREKRVSTKTIDAIDWLEDYARSHGDRMPHTATVYLPYKTVKWSIYGLYKSERSPSVSKSLFYKIWKDYFPNLKVKKANSFSKCNTCAFLDRQLEKCQVASKRAELKKLRTEHNQRQMLERKYYYAKRERSRKNPKEYMSLIIDGMDQSKSSLPHFTGRKAKVMANSDILKTHITGVLDHSRGKFETYLDLNQFPHDPNLTINIILQALKRTATANGNTLPPVCYLQADNCWRENKNKYVLSFCELLVKKKIFNEVHLSFLMVGHTHEDVDAGFSQIASALRKNDCETYEDLRNLLPNCDYITHMFDVRSWLDMHLVHVTKHTQPLHYKFLQAEEHVKVYYKGKQDQPWKRLESSFFKTDILGRSSIPKGKPKLLKESYEHVNIEKLKTLVRNLISYFHKSDSITWWNNFLNQIGKGANTANAPAWYLDQLPKQKAAVANEERESVPEQIQVLMDREREEPQVHTKNRQMMKKRNPTVNNGARKQTKKNQNGRRRHIIRRKVQTLVLYNLDGHVKRHIWFSILSFVIQSIILCLCLMYLLHIYLELILSLLVSPDFLSIINVLNIVWYQILNAHVGQYTARVSLEEKNLIPNYDTLYAQTFDIF